MSEENNNKTFAMKDFHYLHVSRTIEILGIKANGSDFFTAISLNYIAAILNIAKAYRHIPAGARFEQQSGYSVDSPYWVSLVCNDPDMRRDVVVNMESNLNVYKNLRSQDLMNALDLCNNDWENLHLSAEVYERVVLEINSIMGALKDSRFIDNYAHLDDAEIYSGFTSSMVSQDYTFFDNASDGDRIRIFEVAKRTGIDSLSQESVKAFMAYTSAWSVKNQRS